MSVLAHLLALERADLRVAVVATPPELRAAAAANERDGFALVEPDLPIGRLALPADVVDRAVLALVARGRPRELLFVRGERAGTRRVREARVLDLAIALREAPPRSTAPIVDAAMAVLADADAPIAGKELLREARAGGRAGGRVQPSASDASVLAKALVRAWNDGLVDLAPP